MTPAQERITSSVLLEVLAERGQQDEKHGNPDLPDGTGALKFHHAAREVKILVDRRQRLGTLCHRLVLLEEITEVYAESDPVKLRAELLQVAAYAVKWIEAIDRRGGADAP